MFHGVISNQCLTNHSLSWSPAMSFISCNHLLRLINQTPRQNGWLHDVNLLLSESPLVHCIKGGFFLQPVHGGGHQWTTVSWNVLLSLRVCHTFPDLSPFGCQTCCLAADWGRGGDLWGVNYLALSEGEWPVELGSLLCRLILFRVFSALHMHQMIFIYTVL